MCVISPYPSVLQEGRFAGRSTDPQDQDHTDQPQCQESGKRCSHLPFFVVSSYSLTSQIYSLFCGGELACETRFKCDGCRIGTPVLTSFPGLPTIQFMIAYCSWIMETSSLVPRPRPAFRRLQYGKRWKAGRGLGTRLEL